MALYELDDPGELVEPVLIAAFEGWVSAGSAGIGTASHLADDSPIIATFDSDALYDYRANRPPIDFKEGVLQHIHWPEMNLRRRSLGGRDLLILTGTEPNWNWRRFGTEVSRLAESLGVVLHISLGGIPWATAHTRPTSIITTASDESLVVGEHPEGLLRVPGSVVSALEYSIMRNGTPTIGFWAQVPHYVGSMYYPAVLALVERVATQIGVSVPFGTLVDDAREQRTQLDEAIKNQPELQFLVERLESAADEAEGVSGEELAAEIERYLQQAAGDEGGPDLS